MQRRTHDSGLSYFQLPRLTYTPEARRALVEDPNFYCTVTYNNEEVSISDTLTWEQDEPKVSSKPDIVNAVIGFLNTNNIGIRRLGVWVPGKREPFTTTPLTTAPLLTASNLTDYLIDIFYGTPEKIATFKDIKKQSQVILFLQNVPKIINNEL